MHYVARGPIAAAIEQIIENPITTMNTFDLKITSASDPEFNWTARFIDSMFIEQNFSESYGDDITCDIKVSPKDALLLQKNMDDLQATMTITYVGNFIQRKVYSTSPIVKQYRAMLIDPVDLKRSLQGASKQAEENLSISIRLIDRSLYDIRQKQFHGMFRDTTVGELIKVVAASFGIKKVSMVNPDNTHVYSNIHIPPAFGFSDIFGYIQDKYGVYLKGLSYYFSNNTLYIYPAFELKPETLKVAHFYLDVPNGHAGSVSYHRILEGDILEVALQGNPDVVDLSQVGGENVGTAYMFTRSNQVVDGYSETDESGTRFKNNTSMIIGADGARTAGASRNNIRHASTASDNIFTIASDLSKYQAEIVHANWLQAVPWILTPGHRIKYQHDSEGNMQTSSGILEAVAYQFDRVSNAGEGTYVYACVSRVRFRTELGR